jgi:hypothetical protein
LKKKIKDRRNTSSRDSLGGLHVINDVCKPCNDKLGEKVDSHLVNNILMQFARFTKNIIGKKGKIPNPIGKGKFKENPETILHYKFTDDGQPESLYVVPKVTNNGEEYSVSVVASNQIN